MPNTINVTFDTTGLTRQLRQVERAMLDETQDTASDVAINAMRQEAPRRTGMMRASIREESRSSRHVTVSTNVPYGAATNTRRNPWRMRAIAVIRRVLPGQLRVNIDRRLRRFR